MISKMLDMMVMHASMWSGLKILLKNRKKHMICCLVFSDT